MIENQIDPISRWILGRLEAIETGRQITSEVSSVAMTVFNEFAPIRIGEQNIWIPDDHEHSSKIVRKRNIAHKISRRMHLAVRE